VLLPCPVPCPHTLSIVISLWLNVRMLIKYRCVECNWVYTQLPCIKMWWMKSEGDLRCSNRSCSHKFSYTKMPNTCHLSSCSHTVLYFIWGHHTAAEQEVMGLTVSLQPIYSYLRLWPHCLLVHSFTSSKFPVCHIHVFIQQFLSFKSKVNSIYESFVCNYCAYIEKGGSVTFLLSWCSWWLILLMCWRYFTFCSVIWTLSTFIHCCAWLV